MSNVTTTFHCARQATIYSNFCNENKNFDFNIIAGENNTKIPANRFVLSSSSEFFLALFRCNLKEVLEATVELKYIDVVTMKSLLDFMHAAYIGLDIETVQCVLEAADFLQMETLVNACTRFIGDQIDYDNCLSIAFFAEQYCFNGLYEKSFDFACLHFTEVSTQEGFVQLSEEQINKFLSSDDIVTPSEEKVFQSVVTWVEQDYENREKFLKNLLSNVRFGSLTPKFIIDNRLSVCKNIECYEVIQSWLQWHLSPGFCCDYFKKQIEPRVPKLVIAESNVQTQRYGEGFLPGGYENSDDEYSVDIEQYSDDNQSNFSNESYGLNNSVGDSSDFQSDYFPDDNSEVLVDDFSDNNSEILVDDFSDDHQVDDEEDSFFEHPDSNSDVSLDDHPDNNSDVSFDDLPDNNSDASFDDLPDNNSDVSLDDLPDNNSDVSLDDLPDNNSHASSDDISDNNSEMHSDYDRDVFDDYAGDNADVAIDGYSDNNSDVSVNEFYDNNSDDNNSNDYDDDYDDYN